MREYFDSVMHVISNSIETLDLATFSDLTEDVVNALMSDRKVVVTGLGKNVPMCEKFVGTMLSLGLSAAFMHTNTAVHGDLGLVKDGDVVIILSKSGETIESLYLANELCKRDVKLWAITFNEKSTLGEKVERTLIIEMESEGDCWNIVPNNSTTLYLIVLQALSIQVGIAMGVSLDDFRKNHPGGHIGVQLNANEDN